MFQTVNPTFIISALNAAYPYVQLFSVVSIFFGLAWWARSAKSDVISRLDGMKDNHLFHIQRAVEQQLENQAETNEHLVRITTILEERTGVLKGEEEK